VNTGELERRLGDVLRQRAEDAMNSTDTQTRLETLERDLPRNRPRVTIGRVVAAVAVAATVAALVLVNARGDDRTDTPAASVDTQAAIEVASEFVAAVAAYDAGRAASYLAFGAEIRLRTATEGADSMAAQLRWNRAVGWLLLPERCEHATVSAPAPAVTVACTYAVHGLGSQRLGRGPFRGNVLQLTVVDGKIVSGVEHAVPGFEATMWEPFTAWLLTNHADQAAFMYTDWPGATRPALTRRSARLWEQNVDAYVAAVRRGDAS
jgi:hypothetical protein